MGKATGPFGLSLPLEDQWMLFSKVKFGVFLHILDYC